MEMTFQNAIYILLIVLTGMSAGLCFTWTNAVTPGIGQLDDLRFLQSFQQMNRTILNPLFFIVFFGPFFLSVVNIYMLRQSSGTVLWMLIMASVLYTFGLVLVTIFGNVPLNEILDKKQLELLNPEELKVFRGQFETRWNTFHLIRTITSTIAFMLLLLPTIQITK